MWSWGGVGILFSDNHKLSCSRKKIPDISNHPEVQKEQEPHWIPAQSNCSPIWTFPILCTLTLPVLHRISPCIEYSPPTSQSPDADHTIPVYGVPICIPARSVPASDEASPDRACASAPNSELVFPD